MERESGSAAADALSRLRTDEHVTPIDAAEVLKTLPEEEEAVA